MLLNTFRTAGALLRYEMHVLYTFRTSGAGEAFYDSLGEAKGV